MHEIYVEPMIVKMEQYDLHQHDQAYGSDHIVEKDSHDHSPRQSPHQAYTTAFDFQSPTQAHFDQTYSSAPYQTSYSAPQPLHPLNTATLWPSQLTNPSTTSSHAILPVQPRALAPATQDGASSSDDPEPSPPPQKQTPTMPTSRRTLTDNDRRQMCKYHEENPSIKQTDIGSKQSPCAEWNCLRLTSSLAMFGVERRLVRLECYIGSSLQLTL